MRFKYIPGNHPTPMLAFYNEPNLNHFNELLNEMKINPKNKFNNDLIHFWNMNAYLIYNQENNEVVAYAFNDFFYLVYLLRVINRELIIEFNDEVYAWINKDLNEINDELIIIK